MIVPGASIEVYQQAACFKYLKEAVGTQSLQDQDSVVTEELLSLSSFDIGLDVETVGQFGARFVVRIIESPIRLWVEFT